MAISVYSEDELRALVRMPEHVFRSRVLPMSMRDALIFRRNLQISLAQYAKKHRAQDAFGPVHAGVIRFCYLIEKMCRGTFLRVTYRKALPGARARGMQPDAVMRDVLNKWEKLIARSNY